MTAQDVTERPAATGAEATNAASGERLARTISLPLLVFYGLGVTVGAGIFALVGEILGVSGGLAPVAFAVAAGIAGTTAWSYAWFVRRFPRAGGEAVYVAAGLGRRSGTVIGLLVVVAGTVSSAVVALAFGGYLAEAIGVPLRLSAIAMVAVVAVVACRGVRESVTVAALITLIEVGALAVVVAFGAPELISSDTWVQLTEAPAGGAVEAVAAGALLAFFAFIGFEDIANLAEETRNPERNAPRAIAWTLGTSLALYVLVSAIAVSLPNRQAIIDSDAPMAEVFASLSGLDARPMAFIATLAMTNGILIQVIMASRVAFGLASESLLPSSFNFLGNVHPVWRTPWVATLGVAGAVGLLAATAPLATLARWTSVIILIIFASVNASLLQLSRTRTVPSSVRVAALVGCVSSVALTCWQVTDVISG